MFDRFWSPRASLGTTRAAGPTNVRQRCHNDIKIETLRLLWGRLGPKVAPKGGQDGQKLPRTGLPKGYNHVEVFWETLQQKLLFLEMYETPGKQMFFKG